MDLSDKSTPVAVGPNPKKKFLHYTELQNKPIVLSTLAAIQNKLNLNVSVPTYLPLESDALQAHLLYRSQPLKRARSSSYQEK